MDSVLGSILDSPMLGNHQVAQRANTCYKDSQKKRDGNLEKRLLTPDWQGKASTCVLAHGAG